jgi:hypothetical protein
VVAWVTARASALSAFLGAAHSRLLELLTELPKDASALRELEEKMHREIGRCLDIVTAAVLRAAHASPEVLSQVELLLVANPHLRLQDSKEEPLITLLGGSSHRILSPYMLIRLPRGPGRPRGRGKRGRPGNGLYPFLSVLGVHDRVTPALVSEVARQVASCAEEQARSNLARRGIELGKKTLSRLVRNFGSKALQYREQRVLAGMATELGSVAGRRIAIGTDGGRLRSRVPRVRGRKKANKRRGFDAPWREPKVLTIYEIDSEGRQRRLDGFRYYDATMGDADEAFALLAGVLRSVDAGNAAEWVIVGDGAWWIWNRIEDLKAAVGFESKVTEVVDLYHARQKLHEFANEVRSFSTAQRTRWLGRMKKLLDKGDLETMQDEFARYFRGCNSKVRRKLAAYFERNTERMRYDRFRAAKLPLGSGAVESCVRRLVNLRMKGNGIFWRLENAERLLLLRGQLLAGRWDQFVDAVLRPNELWPAS